MGFSAVIAFEEANAFLILHIALFNFNNSTGWLLEASLLFSSSVSFWFFSLELTLIILQSQNFLPSIAYSRDVTDALFVTGMPLGFPVPCCLLLVLLWLWMSLSQAHCQSHKDGVCPHCIKGYLGLGHHYCGVGMT